SISDKDLPRSNWEGRLTKSLEWLRVFQLVEMTEYKSSVLAKRFGSGTNHPNGPEEPRRVSLMDFERNLETMIHLSRSSNAVPVLITEPCTTTDFLPQRHTPYDQPMIDNAKWQPLYNAAISKIAIQEHSLLADTIPVFRTERPYFYDPVH